MKIRIIFVLSLLLIVVGGITTIYLITLSDINNFNKDKLPIIQPRDVHSEMVSPELVNVGIGHRIGDFSFTNQKGETITLADVKGKVFVAEYFFTTCQTICPIMTDQMMRVQEHFKDNDEVKILSFTVDPEVDNVETMNAYAKQHHAVDGQWHFLTGEKEKLYELARKSFFVLKPAEAQNLGDAGSDFIHTNNFVLVDQQLRIRGYYDGTDELEVDTLMVDIATLLVEKDDL